MALYSALRAHVHRDRTYRTMSDHQVSHNGFVDVTVRLISQSSHRRAARPSLATKMNDAQIDREERSF